MIVSQYRNIALGVLFVIMTSCVNRMYHLDADVSKAYKEHSLIIKAHQKNQIFSDADFFNSYFFLQSLSGTDGTLNYHTYFKDINYRTFRKDLKTWNKIIENDLCFYNLLAQKKHGAERFITIVFQQGFFNNDTISFYLNGIPLFEHIVFSSKKIQGDNWVLNLYLTNSLLIADEYSVSNFMLHPGSSTTHTSFDTSSDFLNNPVDVELKYNGKSYTFQVFPHIKKIYWINSNLNSDQENLLFPSLKRDVFLN